LETLEVNNALLENLNDIDEELEDRLLSNLSALLSQLGKASTILVECPICTEAPMKEPMALDCGHMFCNSCHEKWESNKTEDDEEEEETDVEIVKTCPVCRKTPKSDAIKLYF
jgi:hypothetical protein